MPNLIFDPTFQRRVSHLHSLGERALAEFLLEAMPTADARARLMDQLEVSSRGSLEMLATAGGDRFPPAYVYSIDDDGDMRCARRIG